MSRSLRAPALFMASYAMPADMAPSPITAMTLCFLPSRSRATAMPSAAEIDVEEWAAPKGSYSLSARLVNPDRPPPWRSVRMRSRRPVKNLVRVSLMADIPNQLVVRSIENVVQRDGQLDDAKPGAEMAARFGDRIDGLDPQLVSQLFELLG